MGKIATYWRVSTAEQDKSRQVADVHQWLDDHDREFSEVDVFDEGAESGSSVTREKFRDLIEAVETNDYDAVLVSEISRISRKGLLAQEFFDACETAGTDIHVLNGSVDVIKADGTNRLIADIIAAVAAEERRSIIRRTKAGIEASDKWTGNAPAGFVRQEDGYLGVDVESFLRIARALENIENGGSYRGEAKNLDISRQALSKLHKKNRERYLELEDPNEHIQLAIDESELQTVRTHKQTTQARDTSARHRYATHAKPFR